MALKTLRFIDDDAVRAAYPEARTEREGKWFDSSDNEITIDSSKVATEKTRLTNEYNAEEYKRNRRAEYPSVGDQLDQMYHFGFQAWKDEVQKVKEKYLLLAPFVRGRKGEYKKKFLKWLKKVSKDLKLMEKFLNLMNCQI